jgi:hypothetical protein
MIVSNEGGDNRGEIELIKVKGKEKQVEYFYSGGIR